MAATRSQKLWTAFRLVAVPVLVLVLLVVGAMNLLSWWPGQREQYDRDAIKEWIKEARVSNETLRARVADYLASAEKLALLGAPAGPGGGGGFQSGDLLKAEIHSTLKRQEIEEMLETLGVPPTKMYSGQLPLFPVIYFLEIQFHDADLPAELIAPIAWDSGLQRRPGQYRTLENEPIHPNATITVHYSLHTYNKLQQEDLAAAEQQNGRPPWP